MANNDFDLPRPTVPVPSSSSIVANDNSKVLDYVVNSEGTVVTRTGKTIPTLDKVLSGLTLDALGYAPTPVNGGVWAYGQEFNFYNEYMIYNGEAYSPSPATVLPYTVGAAPDLGFVYQIQLNDHTKLSNRNAVGAHDASAINDANGGSVQDFIDKVEGGDLTVIADGSTTPRRLGERFAERLTLEDFGAVGNGSIDDTAAIRAALSQEQPIFLKQGSVYKFIEGNIDINCSIIGYDGVADIEQGNSLDLTKATGFLYAGPSGVENDNVVLFKMRDEYGNQLKDFYIMIPQEGRTSPPAIDNLTGIEVTTAGQGARYIAIEGVEFSYISNPIVFLDDGEAPAADANMDNHFIRGCYFSGHREGILINQTNVYHLQIERPAFYGNYGHTYRHIRCVKGHFDLVGGYFGVLKDENSIGGRDGIACYVQSGFFSMHAVYTETHNAPFLVWDNAQPIVTGASTLSHCIVLGQIATIPTSYNIRNNTDSSLTIVGGYIPLFCENNGAGSISSHGTDSIQFSGVTAGNCTNYGGKVSGSYNVVGGKTGKYKMLDSANPSAFVEVQHASGKWSVTKPGVRNGVLFDFNSGVLDLSTNGWGLKASSNQKGVASITTGNSIVTIPISASLSGQFSGVQLTPLNARAAKTPVYGVVSANSFYVQTTDGYVMPDTGNWNYILL